ncbi:MAG: FecR domain-containing protein [Desulfobaccales bacterium]
MRQKIRLCVMILTLALFVLPLTAQASAVGHFSLVTGEVDVLKQGKLPAVPAKLQDGVEIGDVVRTKSKAKAQLTMVDDSVITLAPDSRLAIADYQYNSASQERRAVVRAFQGLVHTVVNRIIKTEEPDFIMETHTATIGVRGTDFYNLEGPNFSLVALRNGSLAVNGVILHSMQFIHAPKPLVPQTLTPEILRMLEQMMDTGISGGGLNLGGLSSGKGSQFQSPVNPLLSPDQKLLMQTIPPVLLPQQQQPAPVHTQPFGT